MGQRPPSPLGRGGALDSIRLGQQKTKRQNLKYKKGWNLSQKKTERQTDKRQKRCEDSVLGQQKMEIQKDLDTEVIYRKQII